MKRIVNSVKISLFALILLGHLGFSLPAMAATQTLTILGGNGTPGNLDPYAEASRDGGATWGPAYLYDGNHANGPHPWGALTGTNAWINFDLSPFVGLNSTTDYRIRFNVPADLTAPAMTFSLKADNIATIKINGVLVDTVEGQVNNVDVADAVFNAGLVPGLNEITIKLQDFGGWVGLNYVIEITGDSTEPMELVNVAPVASWQADDDATDASGNGNNGTLNGNTGYVDGLCAGRAFSFDGVDDFVEVPDSDSLDITGPITIDAWIRLDNTNTLNTIVSKGGNLGGTYGLNYSFRIGIDGKLTFFYWNNNQWQGWRDSENLSTAQWYHVAAVQEAEGGISFYINGQKTPGTFSYIWGSPGTYPKLTNSEPLRIGRIAGWSQDFAGAIDNLEIFDRALSEAEILGRYNACGFTNTPPVAVSTNVTVVANCETDTADADVNNGSSDPDGHPITLTQNPAGPYGIGDTSVTLTATDSYGASHSAAPVTVIVVDDTTAPNAVAQDVIVELDANGVATLQASAVNNGSSDNCSQIILSVLPGSFDCSDVGPKDVTLTVTDLANNTDSDTATATVQDNINPVASTLQNITVELDENGSASITVADVNNGSSDNCEIESLSVSQTAFDCSNVGDNTVTLTVTDINGNTDTADTTVAVEDNIAPDAKAKDIVVQLGANGIVTIDSTDVDDGSSDNCGFEMSVSPNTFNCADVHTNLMTFGSGPHVQPPAGFSYSEAGYTMTTTGDLFNFRGPWVPSNPDFESGYVETWNASVIFTFTNDNNDLFDFVGIDVGHVLNSPGTWILKGFQGAALAASVSVNTSLGNAINLSGFTSLTSLTIQKTAGTFPSFDNIVFSSNAGRRMVTLTVEDNSGNTSTDTATVTVVDATPPTITCPAGVTLECPADISPTNTGSATATDNCGVVSITSSDSSVADCGNTETITRTWTATDTSGNTASCVQTITVVDTTPPVLSDKPDADTVECDAVPAMPDITATDNCDGDLSVTATEVRTDGDCANSYTLTRTWSATDSCGNSDSYTQKIMVVDTKAPHNVVAILEPVKVRKKHGCFRVVLTADDNCDIDPLTFTATLRTGTCEEAVTNGQLVRLHLKKKSCRIKHDDGNSDDGSSDDCGTVKFEGPDFTLTATAEDACGNVSDSVTDSHVFDDGSSDDDGSHDNGIHRGNKKKDNHKDHGKHKSEGKDKKHGDGGGDDGGGR